MKISPNTHSIRVLIPAKIWPSFKGRILKIDWTSSEPVLTRNINRLAEINPVYADYEMATMAVNFQEDVDLFISLLPKSAMLVSGPSVVL